jgi:short-subunit dehydrogenase
MRLEGAVALVTGASRGIGLSLAEALAARGARHVYGTARKPDAFRRSATLDQARFTLLRMDVTDESSVADVALLTNDVTLLINNAGILSHGDILQADRTTIRSEIETNCLGLVNVVRHFAPAIARNGGGVIMNVLSVSALASAPNLGVYAASKAAAWAATQAMRATLAPKNIRVLAAFPGPVDTDMSRSLEVRKAAPMDVAEGLLTGIEAEQEEIFPDDMAKQTGGVWRSNPKMLMRQFALL